MSAPRGILALLLACAATALLVWLQTAHSRALEELLLVTLAMRAKIDCLRAAPAVCVEVDNLIRCRTGPSVCDDWSAGYESVIGFGKAEIAEDAAEKLRGLRALMSKHSGREDWEFSDASIRGTAVVRIRLESLTGKRSPAGGQGRPSPDGCGWVYLMIGRVRSCCPLGVQAAEAAGDLTGTVGSGSRRASRSLLVGSRRASPSLPGWRLIDSR